MMHLFAYGTLICEDIMEEVSGCRLTPEPGTLSNYRRLRVKDEHYPAIVPYEQSRVEGVVYRNVPLLAWERLDAFEGEMYTRQIVPIILGDGPTISAETYVARPEYWEYLEQTEWQFDEFLRTGKAKFQQLYQGYQCI